MCCGSAACRADLHKCDHFNFFLLGGGGGGGGGVVRLTAKPRYLLLLHRGKEKSNTVTALLDTVYTEHLQDDTGCRGTLRQTASVLNVRVLSLFTQ